MKNIYELRYSKVTIDSVVQDNRNPVVISFTNTHGDLTTTPIWTYYHEDDGKFYFFSSKTSMKVRSVEAGHSEFTLVIINRNSFPVVHDEEVPYISMTGRMKIITKDDTPDLTQIHLNLLQKYSDPEQEKWFFSLIKRLEDNPIDVWMLQFTPKIIRHY